MAGAVGPRPAPTLRLLCLHGRGTDGAGLERAMEEAQQQANLPSVAFEFLDAPYASGAPPSAPLDDAPAGASARCWWRERWNGDLGRVDYEGAERSVAAVLARLAASADRPYDGLLGEGQGGELAAVVLAMQIRGEFPRGVPRSLRYGWVQNASVPRDGAVARPLGDGRALRDRAGGSPAILVTALVREDAGDPRTLGPCDLSRRLGSVFAAQYFGNDDGPTQLAAPRDRDDDEVTAFVHAFFSPDADETMRRMCAACGQRARFSCSRCHTARYCSRDCQKDHWPLHRGDCARAAEDQRSRNAETAALLAKARSQLPETPEDVAARQADFDRIVAAQDRALGLDDDATCLPEGVLDAARGGVVEVEL